ncbi:MAG: hypothetical protein ACI9W4_002061 [Rhodothermales bacterium]|jgi:hypothetical protein
MPPPPDSALKFQPLAVVRSLLAIGLGYGLHGYALYWITEMTWGGLIDAPSTILVPVAVVLLLLSIVVGGAVAGNLAGRRPGGHGLAVGAITLITLVAGTFNQDMIEPGWFRIIGAVVSLPMAYLGSELLTPKKVQKPR